MTPYRASGKAPIGGIILLLVLTVVGGVAIGAAAYFISKLIYLIILFPLVMAVLGGAIVNFGIKLGKIRNGFVALLFGVLMVASIYGSYRIGEYLGFKQEIYDIADEEAGETVDRALVDEFIEEQLEYETGSTGFIGFTKYIAQQGIDISYRTTDIHLEETATWIYWGVEILALLIIIPMMTVGAAGEPFSEDCNRWFDSGDKRIYVGNIPADSASQFQSLMQTNDVRSAAALVSPKPQDYPMLHLYAYRAGDCREGAVLLRGVDQKTDNRGKTTVDEQFSGLVQPMYFDDLTRRVQAKIDEAPALA